MAKQQPESAERHGLRSGADEFESRFMADESEVRHRDKRVSRGMAGLLGAVGLLTVALSIFLGFANATASKPVPTAALPFVVGGVAALGVAFVVMGLMFAVVRTVVTAQDVLIKYGLTGPKIALDSITTCRVVDYQWTRFGGFGIRIAADGTRAYVPGPGKVVALTYRDGADEKQVLVGAGDPHGVAQAIDRARRARGGVRIALEPSDAEAQAELEAETEVQAALEAEAEARRTAGHG